MPRPSSLRPRASRRPGLSLSPKVSVRPRVSRPPEQVIETLRNWVSGHFGIAFAGDQKALFGSRITALCAQTFLTPEKLLERVRGGDRDLTLRLAEAVSTNHTFFFRERETFDVLSTSVLPTLAGGNVRIWSAAASSGDEAYSLAIAALEQYGEHSADRVRILGTDLSDRQVRSAEQGIYPMAQLTQVGSARLQRWFKPAGLGHFRVNEVLRKVCTFRRMNLTQTPWPFEQRFQVIFLRNVLYYFEAATQRQIVESCYDAAEPGGWLITSVTEPMLDLNTRWSRIAPAIYRRGY